MNGQMVEEVPACDEGVCPESRIREKIYKRSLKAVGRCALVPLPPLQHLRTSWIRLALSCPSPPSQRIERTLRN